MTVPVTATAAVVTTREMAVAVGTTKQAVMAAVAVGTAKEAARACTLPTSCGSTPRNLRSPYLTTRHVIDCFHRAVSLTDFIGGGS